MKASRGVRSCGAAGSTDSIGRRARRSVGHPERRGLRWAATRCPAPCHPASCRRSHRRARRGKNQCPSPDGALRSPRGRSSVGPRGVRARRRSASSRSTVSASPSSAGAGWSAASSVSRRPDTSSVLSGNPCRPNAPPSKRESSLVSARTSSARRRGIRPSGSGPWRESWVASPFWGERTAARSRRTSEHHVIDLVRGEFELHGPARFVLPARPALPARVQVGELGTHGGPEGRVLLDIEIASDDHGNSEGAVDDVLALGQHRPLEAAHGLDLDRQQFGGLLGREPCADARLDVARARSERSRGLLSSRP